MPTMSQSPTKIARLQSSLRFRLRRWGGTGWLFIGAIFVLLLFELGWILPAIRQRDALTTRLPETVPENNSAIRAALSSDTGDGLAAFYRMFPPESLVLNATEQINAAADAAGVHISQADYHLNSDPSGLERADIVLAARATYTQLRTFTSAVLSSSQTTSLDGLTMSRNSPTDGELDIQFHFSLFVRSNDL